MFVISLVFRELSHGKDITLKQSYAKKQITVVFKTSIFSFFFHSITLREKLQK